MNVKRIFSEYFSIIVFSIFVIIRTGGFAQDNCASPFLTNPTGGCRIGIKELFLTDSSRLEKYEKNKSFRKIAVKIWYPAELKDQIENESYLSSYPTDILYDIFKSKGIKKPFLDSIKLHKTFSCSQVPISAEYKQYPVLIFSSGYYFGMTDLYLCLLENLASNGYIVCCLTHPYEQPYQKFPDGSEIYLNKGKTRLAYFQLLLANKLQFRKRDSEKDVEIITRNYLKKLKLFDKALKIWVDDTEFFVDFMMKKSQDENNFFNKIDPTRVGAFGHSFGGAVSGQVCKIDSRIKAGINMDCFQFGNIIDNPLEVPFMLIESSNYPDWNTGNGVIYSNCKSDFYRLSINNASHFIFSDAAVIPFGSPIVRTGFIGEVDGNKTMVLVNKYILSFFDKYLNQKQATLLDEKINTPEIKFDLKRH